MKERVTSHVDAWYVKGNILVTRNGQACLADFGIAGAFKGVEDHNHKLGTLRHMAPERFSGDVSGDTVSLPLINGPTKEGDVYSLAMTSFEVRSSAANHPAA
jgi:serine/threonine protein kinase